MIKSLIQIIEDLWFLFIKKDLIKYARKIGVRIGDGCEIQSNPRKIFGSEPYLIKLGNHVRVTSGVRFITHDGTIWNLRELKKEFSDLDYFAPISVGDNVFIGFNSIIMPGVSIGNNVIIGACSVVTKDVSDNSVIAGIPARKISDLSDYVESICKREIFNTKKLSYVSKKNMLMKMHPEWFK